MDALFAFLATPEGQAIAVATLGAVSALIGKSKRFGGEEWKTLKRIAKAVK